MVCNNTIVRNDLAPTYFPGTNIVVESRLRANVARRFNNTTRRHGREHFRGRISNRTSATVSRSTGIP